MEQNLAEHTEAGEGFSAPDVQYSDDPAILLEQIIPFRFLPQEKRAALAPLLVRRHFAPGEVIMHQGDGDDRTVYLIRAGSVDVFDRRAGHSTGTLIEPGHYFGEWEPLFDEPRVYEIHAIDEVDCFSMSGEQFLSLFEGAPAFAQAFGIILRDKQGIFVPFDRFRAELMRSAIQGNISIERLLPFYRELEPALHPQVGSATILDLKALAYAVRRLPDNITRTFAFYATDEPPATFGMPDRYFPEVSSAARRRNIWEMLPGKDLVLMRNGTSDLVDLLTCLCVYSVEAQKLRHRLQQPEVLAIVERGAAEIADISAVNDRTERVRQVLASLPFSPQEQSDLMVIWSDYTVARLSDLTRHREMFSVDVRRHTNKYNSRRSELWTSQLAAATRSHMGCDPAELPSDLEVHIISSNTHSVSNCLNPWYRLNRERVLDWARRGGHPLLQRPWKNEFDALYAVVRDFFVDDPDRAVEAKRYGLDRGIYRLEETASTGIQVQLIDAERLAGMPVDPGVADVPRGTRKLLVNIDYAFGEQAEHIIRNLLLLYGPLVRSVSFLGKAGALVGSRGDMLAPTAFIEQSTDLYQPLPQADPQAISRLQSATGREVHQGAMLTAEGTLMQNRTMLHFYRRMWNCVGIEMEGVYYYKQVMESRALGVIPQETRVRSYYYVSDLPLMTNFGLSDRLQAEEGVPPLYAITREILSEIFTTSDAVSR
ncbi:DUF6909 family protein [Salinispira pacifica]